MGGNASAVLAVLALTTALAGAVYAVVVIDGAELPVSRRHTRDLKDKLIRAAKQDWIR